MKRIISILTVLTLLCTAVAFTLSASAGVENIVGYSSQRVVKKDLTNVPSILDFNKDNPGTEYKLESLSDWEELEFYVNTEFVDFVGITIYLANNIYPEQNTKIFGLGCTVSSVHHTFKGTFDGQGYTIENVSIALRGGDGVGLFAFVKDATIKNVILGEKCVIESPSKGQVGGIVGRVQGEATTTVDNCWNKATINASGKQLVGGIVGQPSNDSGKSVTLIVSNCTNSGKITAQERVGGIIGRAASAKVEVTNCLNTGEVVAADTKTVAEWKSSNAESTNENLARKMGVAGIVGESGATTDNLIITGCVNTGKISGYKCVGGILGFIPIGSGATIRNCENYGTTDLKVNGGFEGQIVGKYNDNTSPVNASENLEKEGQTWTPVETDPPAEPLVPDGSNENENDNNNNNNNNDDNSNIVTNDKGNDKTDKSDDTTDAVETTAQTESDTEAAEEGGCGGMYAGSAIAVMGVIAAATGAFAKRRKEN